MKWFSSELQKFAISFAIVSILFRYGLSEAIDSGANALIWAIAILYFLVNSALGWYFGERDSERNLWADIGFRLHLITYTIFNSIWFVWLWLGWASNHENYNTAIRTALIWGGFLVIHFVAYLFYRRQTIKGIDREELFE